MVDGRVDPMEMMMVVQKVVLMVLWMAVLLVVQSDVLTVVT